MVIKNIEIRQEIATARLKHWEVAQAAGIDASTLSRWLRVDLTSERQERIERAIKELTKG